ncbi:hypothetical protein B0H17DRAFT_1034413, partial [Mycena rosella]
GSSPTSSPSRRPIPRGTTTRPFRGSPSPRSHASSPSSPSPFTAQTRDAALERVRRAPPAPLAPRTRSPRRRPSPRGTTTRPSRGSPSPPRVLPRRSRPRAPRPRLDRPRRELPRERRTSYHGRRAARRCLRRAFHRECARTYLFLVWDDLLTTSSVEPNATLPRGALVQLMMGYAGVARAEGRGPECGFGACGRAARGGTLPEAQRRLDDVHLSQLANYIVQNRPAY